MSKKYLRVWQAFLTVIVLETVLITPTPDVLSNGIGSTRDFVLHYGVGVLLMGLPLLQILGVSMIHSSRRFLYWANLVVPSTIIASAAGAANFGLLVAQSGSVDETTTLQVVLGWVALGLMIQSVVFALPNVILFLTTCIAMLFRKHPSKL